MKDALWLFLTSNAPIAALVGDRIYPMLAPSSKIQNRPYVTIQRINQEVMGDHLTGVENLIRDSWQITVWADDRDADAGTGGQKTLELVSKTIRQQINASRSSTAVWGEDVRRVIVKNIIDSMEQIQDGSQLAVFQCVMDCDIIYREA